MDDFRKILYGVVLAFIGVILLWVSFVTYSGCGFSLNNCNASVAPVLRTPIPSLVPATLPAPARFLVPTGTATTGAKATAAATETSAPAVSGGEEVARPSNPGGPGEAVNLKGSSSSGVEIFAANCQICHAAQGKGGNPNPGSSDGTIPALNPIDPTIANADYKTFATNVDLFVEHGSTPDGTNPTFSMPAWGDKKLLSPQQIADVIAYVVSLNGGSASTSGTGAGSSAQAVPTQTTAVSPAATSAPTAEATSASGAGSGVAHPSNPGGPGDAVNLKGDATAGAQVFANNCAVCHNTNGTGGNPNPGSTDGTIPALNPIDPTLKNPDYKTFATNLDLFIQHGSTPDGPGPTFSMPPWGDSGKLTQQQIADAIAYLISLNP